MLFYSENDVIIWSIRDVVENSVDITFTIEVNGQPMNPDDVENTVEIYNEEIIEDICTNCEVKSLSVLSSILSEKALTLTFKLMNNN